MGKTLLNKVKKRTVGKLAALSVVLTLATGCIDVFNKNHVPEFVSTPPARVKEGQTVRYDAVTNDADGNKVHILLYGDAIFSHKPGTNRIIAEAPMVDRDTEYHAVIEASDVFDSAYQDWNLIVENVADDSHY
jgi:hypothetical protein